MIWDIIGMVLISVFIILFGVSSIVISWGKQTEKYNRRRKK